MLYQGMAGARRFEELLIWQIADQLRIATFALCEQSSFARDLRLKSQTEDAVNSICRNVAEGFGCDTHAEFVRYLGISRRSANELRDAFRAALLKSYVSPADLIPIHECLRRFFPALGKFVAYLRRTPDPPRRLQRPSTKTCAKVTRPGHDE